MLYFWRVITRIFLSKWFIRFARKEGIADNALCEAVRKAERGLVDAELGSGVIKQRIARPGEGKSGGYRGIVLLRSGDRAFFVYGFAKNERDNIDDDELRGFKRLAREMLAIDDGVIERMKRSGGLKELMCDVDAKNIQE